MLIRHHIEQMVGVKRRDSRSVSLLAVEMFFIDNIQLLRDTWGKSSITKRHWENILNNSGAVLKTLPQNISPRIPICSVTAAEQLDF